MPDWFEKTNLFVHGGQLQGSYGNSSCNKCSASCMYMHLKSADFVQKERSNWTNWINFLLLTDSLYLSSRFSCAAREAQNSAKLNFHGDHRVWDGRTIKSKLKGGSALYIVLEDEVHFKYIKYVWFFVCFYYQSKKITSTSKCQVKEPKTNKKVSKTKNSQIKTNF